MPRKHREQKQKEARAGRLRIPIQQTMASDDRNQTAKIQPAPVRAALPRRRIISLALTGLFFLAAFYTLYFMRAMLLPLVLALLLSYLLVPLVRGLGYLRIRPILGAAIVLVVL